MWLVIAAAVSAAATWCARGYALRRRLIDEPGERRSHAVATPRGGGIGPVAGFALLLVVAGWTGGLAGADWRWLLAGLVGVAAIGAWDDHRPLGASVRLAIHGFAGIALAAGLQLWSVDAWAAIGVAVGAVVLINVWNFMDGINGLAATQTAICAGAAALLLTGTWRWLSVGVVLAVLAFIPFNFPRARIFLGDVGSGPLGLVVGFLAAGFSADWPEAYRASLLLFPAAAFLVDAGLTLARRVVRGERWWTAHTQHAYQAASRRFGHVGVTMAYAAWSIVGASLSLACASRDALVTMAALMLWYIASAALWAWMQWRAPRWNEFA